MSNTETELSSIIENFKNLEDQISSLNEKTAAVLSKVSEEFKEKLEQLKKDHHSELQSSREEKSKLESFKSDLLAKNRELELKVEDSTQLQTSLSTELNACKQELANVRDQLNEARDKLMKQNF